MTQAEFPYGQLLEENRRRGKRQPEFELLDTGIFNDNRYFDVFVEYAKADAEDILIKITVANLGSDFKVECPTGSGKMITLWEVAGELSRRLTNIFLQDEKGRRPVFAKLEKFQTDPQWRDLILFHEYFHGDSGAGLGASHQTGWTGVVTKLMQQSGEARERKKTEDIRWEPARHDSVPTGNLR